MDTNTLLESSLRRAGPSIDTEADAILNWAWSLRGGGDWPIDDDDEIDLSEVPS